MWVHIETLKQIIQKKRLWRREQLEEILLKCSIRSDEKEVREDDTKK